MEAPSSTSVFKSASGRGLRLSRHHGTLSIEGPAVDDLALEWLQKCRVCSTFSANREARDGTPSYHITIITKVECASLTMLTSTVDGAVIPAELLDVITTADMTTFCDEATLFGVGVSEYNNSADTVVFLTVFCEWADRLRTKLGLPCKHHHITLGFSVCDLHDIDKSFNTVKHWDSEPVLYARLAETFTSKQRAEACAAKLIILLSKVVYYYLDTLQEMYPLLCGPASQILTGYPSDHKSNMEVLRSLCQYSGELGQLGLLSEIAAWQLSRGLVAVALRVLTWYVARLQRTYRECNCSIFEFDSSLVDCLLPIRVRSQAQKTVPTTNAEKKVTMIREKMLLWQWNTVHTANISSPDYLESPTSKVSASSTFPGKHATVYSIGYQVSDSAPNPVPKSLSSASSTVTVPTPIFDKFQLPRNFSFVQSFLSCPNSHSAPGSAMLHFLAGSAIPTSVGHICALHGVGVGLIVTLHEILLSAGVY
jgi:hypothetical protein